MATDDKGLIRRADSQPARLTPQQRRVVDLTSKGLTPLAIAERLGTSTANVYSVASVARRKMTCSKG
jgi:DNA-binding CsgD family transcriptional regulator